MPPKLNPLPQLIPNRILMLRNLLREKLWDARQDVDVVTSAVFDTPVPLAEAAALSYRPILPGEYFGEPHGEWQQCWFRTEIPPAAAGQSGRRYFFWDCRGESTVFIDGQPWAGLDVAHPYCILPDRACTLWIDCGTYQTCIWFDNGKPIDQYGLRFEGAWIACRNPAAWETFWDLDVLTEWMLFLLKRDGLENMARPWGPIPELRQAHPVLRKLIGMFDEAFAAWEKGGESALGPELKRIYAAFPGESWQAKVKMIGHSHLDLVWMWPEYVGERKAVHTMATAMRLLEEYPQYRFMWTSPHSMKMIENQFPGLYGAVKEKIQEGRWEATGGAWVEFDTLVACGEALGRSLALGQRMFEKLRGSISTTVWLPDCFGFNGFLPQIMSQAGVKNFYTTKLSWSVVTEFPYDSFIWRAADGSEVITHLNAAAPSGETLTGMVEASHSYRQLDVDNEILKYTGVGDGGGGTTVDRMEWFNRLGSLAQVPSVEWGSVEGFFEQLDQKRSRLPVFEGELYLEFHRGIYTTESEYKRVYRRMERSLQAWEAARALTGAGPVPEHYWERLCFNQFHDALPGSSIKLVYDQLGGELESLGTEVLDRAAAELAEGGTADGSTGVLGVFNPLAFDRRVVVEVPAVDGTNLTVQPVQTPQGELLLASVALKGMSMTALDSVEAAPGGTWEVSPRVLDNGVLRVEFDEAGQIQQVSDHGKPWPLAGAPGLVLHPDLPPFFDAWEIDHCAPRTTIDEIRGLALQVSERGPVRAVLSGTAHLGESSCVLVRYILEAGSDVLGMEMDVDWQEEHRLLRYYLPTTLRGRDAHYGAPYGSLTRGQTPGMPREEAMWEVPGSRWAALSDDLGKEGLAIITEAKYGFACRDGELALTLLRAPLDPAMDSEQNPHRHRPDQQVEFGMHTIRFAIARHHAFSQGETLSTPAMAEALYAPVLVAPMAASRNAPFCFAGDLGTMVPTWVLPSQTGGYILRLNETSGATGAVTVVFAAPPADVSQVDFLERPTGGACIEKINECEYRVNYGPYQLISLRVRI